MKLPSIGDLPFVERDGADLLGVDGRDVDPDFYGFGHFRATRIVLSDDADGGPSVIENALVLVLHTAEDSDHSGSDLELEFFLDELGEDVSVTALLSSFLDIWLPRLWSGGEPVILALCNPQNVRIERPADLPGDVDVFAAEGDVNAWLDGDVLPGTEPTIGLGATRWRRL